MSKEQLNLEQEPGWTPPDIEICWRGLQIIISGQLMTPEEAEHLVESLEADYGENL